MIYVRADDQDNPRSVIQVEVEGNYLLILQEACSLLDEIYKIDPWLFDAIVKGVIRKNADEFNHRIQEWKHDSYTE